MVDVIKIDLGGRFGGCEGPGWARVQDVDIKLWEPRVTTRWCPNPVTGQPQAQRWKSFKHKRTGLQIMGPADFGPFTIEASWSRLLWGDANGKLIRNQGHLDECAAIVVKLIRQVSPGTIFSIRSVTRIELTWHFSGSPCEWVPFLSSLKHPRVEAFPISYREEFIQDDHCIHAACGSFLRQRTVSASFCPTGVTWTGERLKIRLYDKVAQMRLSHHMASVMRLEFVLSDRLTTGLVQGGQLAFDLLYERYRQLAGQFRDFRRVRDIYGSPIDFLVSLRARGMLPEHEFQNFLAAQSRATRYRHIGRLRTLAQLWETVPGVISRLPECGPPNDIEAPDVVAPERISGRGFQ